AAAQSAGHATGASRARHASGAVGWAGPDGHVRLVGRGLGGGLDDRQRAHGRHGPWRRRGAPASGAAGVEVPCRAGPSRHGAGRGALPRRDAGLAPLAPLAPLGRGGS
ncbi:hypothetical protein EMIHUDRAFT_455058, partial [Emiliania huxleyi CCMP1516]|uniref:Uncharacterized protein n=2 Tax=Emiliania huxleyi TaxID=2903 RepID=A0A0D3KL85_EMIH1